MKKNLRNSIAICFSIGLGILLIYFGTDGLQAFTAESARTHQLLEDKPLFPLVELEDSEKRSYTFSEFEGKYVLMTFFYTSCSDTCPILEMNQGEVFNQIPDQHIGEDIIFLSLSFDPERDDPETLTTYQSLFNSDGDSWRMATVPDEKELERMLDAFGVVVIPDGSGGFAHNSAFYLVDRERNLTDIMDYTKPDEAAEKVIHVLENDVEG